jgi:hypothetical protein
VFFCFFLNAYGFGFLAPVTGLRDGIRNPFKEGAALLGSGFLGDFGDGQAAIADVVDQTVEGRLGGSR